MSRSTLAVVVRHLRAKLACQEQSKESDEQLLHAFLASRDDSAFAVLRRRYGPMVLHVCRRVLGHEQDAEDAFQATFLVLANKADTLRRKTALASWLYGTAYRIALKSKQSAERRHKHEIQATTRPSLDPCDELLWRKVRTLLDEEIARLPEKCRSVFVLCCMEELSQAEAGRRMGLKEGTMANRLAEARKRLAHRLARRGVELTAVLAACTLAAKQTSALPAGLMASTIEAAWTMALDEGAAGLVSANVTGLVKSAASAAMLNKIKIVAAVLLAGSVLAGTGAWISSANRVPLSVQAPRSPSGSKPQPLQAKNAQSPQREKNENVTVKGRVLGPDGKPVKGAKLYVSAEPHDPGKPRSVTGADGSFRLNLEPPAVGWRPRQLAAVAEGYGMDWLYLEKRPLKGEQILRLAPAASIRGRIIDLEGRPVAKATVRVAKLIASVEEDLSAFLNAWRKGADFYEAFRLLANKWPPKWIEDTAAFPEVFAPVSTDANGYFTITPIGQERLVLLRVSGADKADQWEWVVTPRADFQAPAADAKRVKIQGSRPTIAVGPSRPIAGTVREKGSGRPLAGVRVVSFGLRMESQRLETTTDEQGRYRLDGLPKAPSHALSFLPGEGRPHLPRFLTVSDKAPGLQPVRLDVELIKGIVLRGQIKDRTTSLPVRGIVRYAPLAHNEFVARTPDYVPKLGSYFSDAGEALTDAEGRYQVTILPGPGILMVPHLGDGRTIPRPYVHAKLASTDAKNDKIFDRSLRVFRVYLGVAGGAIYRPTALYAYRVIDPQSRSAELNEEFLLDPGRSRKVQLLDPLGKPLAGAIAAGMHPTGRPWLDTLSDSVVTVAALDPSAPRRVCFLHQDRKLAAVVRLRGDESEPVVVKLQPCGEVTGRLLSADGKPLADFLINVYPPGEDSLSREFGNFWNEKTRTTPICTGADGRYRIDCLPPELKFDLWFSRKSPYPPLPSLKGLAVKSGQTLDLGDLRVKPSP